MKAFLSMGTKAFAHEKIQMEVHQVSREMIDNHPKCRKTQHHPDLKNYWL